MRFDDHDHGEFYKLTSRCTVKSHRLHLDILYLYKFMLNMSILSIYSYSFNSTHRAGLLDFLDHLLLHSKGVILYVNPSFSEFVITLTLLSLSLIYLEIN